ncbi:MAG: SIS domain-containing protein [Acidobacteriota bacterium]
MKPCIADPAPPADGEELRQARRVFQVEAQAILDLGTRLDAAFQQAVEALATCRGRVVTTGMGKSGLIARKLAATLSSTGTPSLFLHPAEAAHGDLGSVVEGDVLVALSHSGETEEIARLLETIKRLGIPLIALTGSLDSTLARQADVALDVGVRAEACPLGLAPTASTTASLAMGDALAMSVLSRKGFQEEDFAAIHPGGRLGARLRRVSDLMHTGTSIPLVALDSGLDQVIRTISAGCLGMTAVVNDAGHLAGIITDGDLRRLLQGQGPAGSRITSNPRLCASEFMSHHPITIAPGALASEALRLMESHKITSLVVPDQDRRPVGIIHLHDLWRMELI